MSKTSRSRSGTTLPPITTVNVDIRVRPIPDTSGKSSTFDPKFTIPSIEISAGSSVAIGEKRFNYANSIITGSEQSLAMTQLLNPLIESIKEGSSNSTLLAYGQTGSGKTHTLFGAPGSLTVTSLQREGGGRVGGWGLIPLAMLETLELAGETGKVRVSVN